MKKPVNRDVGAQLPIFGVDTAEIEALRALENLAWRYVHEDASFGELVSALNSVRAVRRKRKHN
jgi:hypothetical protein